VDCLNEKHVETICHAAVDLRLITGSSAFGTRMPALLREREWVSDEGVTSDPAAFKVDGHGCLLVAGSCSIATRQQNEWFASRGFPVVQLNPRELLAGEFDRFSFRSDVSGHLAAGQHCLITTTGSPADVRQVQEWGAANGFTVSELGQKIASSLADLVLEILSNQAAAGLIVAGGETAGALCRLLRLGALRVGRNIEPGVPLCFSLGEFRLPVVLKSGNFGSTDFYGKALHAALGPDAYLI
jgi:uncharacterized protein YgbK (DUF1537 family)